MNTAIDITTTATATPASDAIATATVLWRACGGAIKLTDTCREAVAQGDQAIVDATDAFIILYQDNKAFPKRWAVMRASMGREGTRAGKKIVFRKDIGETRIEDRETKQTTKVSAKTSDGVQAIAGQAMADKPVKALEALLSTMVATDIAKALLAMPQDKIAAITAAITKATERKPARPRKAAKSTAK